MTTKRKPPKLPNPRVEYHILEGDGATFVPHNAINLEAVRGRRINSFGVHTITEPARVIVATTTYTELEPGT
jgi:hypothetical protein